MSKEEQAADGFEGAVAVFLAALGEAIVDLDRHDLGGMPSAMFAALLVAHLGRSTITREDREYQEDLKTLLRLLDQAIQATTEFRSIEDDLQRVFDESSSEGNS